MCSAAPLMISVLKSKQRVARTKWLCYINRRLKARSLPSGVHLLFFFFFFFSEPLPFDSAFVYLCRGAWTLLMARRGTLILHLFKALPRVTGSL